MEKLFIGYLFLALELKIYVGSAAVGLLPDFVGYLLLFLGLTELRGESRFFARAKPWALGLCVYTGALYVLDLIALSVPMRVLRWGLGAAALAAGLVVSHWVVRGVQDVEQRRCRDLAGQRLGTIWLYRAVLNAICYSLGWVPVAGTACAVAAFIMGVCFLAALYKSAKLYAKK